MRLTLHDVEGRVGDRKGILNGEMFGSKGRELEAQWVRNKHSVVGINTLNVSRCPIYGINTGH